MKVLVTVALAESPQMDMMRSSRQECISHSSNVLRVLGVVRDGAGIACDRPTLPTRLCVASGARYSPLPSSLHTVCTAVCKSQFVMCADGRTSILFSECFVSVTFLKVVSQAVFLKPSPDHSTVL
jgi:hypothetical protein